MPRAQIGVPVARRAGTRTGGLVGTSPTETVRFALDGQSYEIDLSPADAAEMREALAPYVQAGRRLTRSGKPYVRIDLDARPRRR